ncbi:acetylcholine receptor subunit alpha-type unc-38-like [Dreissena polymorpha]|uniref:acetylcholine receptor subunit alpha-type unc-38-like n=1 Tax=Dreissena polymorpha TaxID=45954 RepID=UPI002263AD3A|nr:acetylcholine receptor subunit alpha-type unc-38-like [Dreissena polymorpha]
MAIAWLLPRFIQCQTQDQVEALYNNLLNGQNKNMRPAVNHAYPTDVNVSFELFQILDVDEVMVLYLKRRPTFVIVNVVLPIFFMSVLNVLVFFLPASSGERVSFAITVLLAIAFFMTIVNDTLPKSSNPIPTICYLLLGSLVLSTFIVMMTIFNLRIYHRPAEQPLSKMYLAIAFSARRCRRRSFRCQSKRIKADAVTEIDLSKENAITNRRASDEDAIKWSSAHNNKRRADDATASAYEDYADLEDVNWKTVSEALDSIGIVISTVWVVSLTIAIIVMVTAYS